MALAQDPPLVTVLMAVYNSAPFLAAAIDSVLAQTFLGFELLIINDGSTDDSRAIITSYRDPRIRLIDNPANIGLTASLNRGLAQARGALIARQDSDDLARPERLARQVAYLARHPQLVLLGTQKQHINAQGRAIAMPFVARRATSSTAIRWQLLFENAFVHSSVMFRRDMVWHHLGGYDERLRQAQDLALWSRIARHYATANLPDVLVDFRKHSASVGARQPPEGVPAIDAIFRANLRQFLQVAQPPDGWHTRLHALRTGARGGPLARPWEMALLIRTLHNRFAACHPAAATDPDVARYTAHLLAQVAYLSTGGDRPTSWQLYWQACRADPAIVRRISAFRYLLHWVRGTR
jgi:hypothetical protein